MKTLIFSTFTAVLLSPWGLGQDEKLITRTYQLSNDVFQAFSDEERAEIAQFDPFGDPPPPKELARQVDPQKTLTALKLLEFKGVNFGPGATASYDPATMQLAVTNTELQLEVVEVFLTSWKNAGEKMINVIVEFIEMEHGDFSDWLFENRLIGNATPLRQEIQKWVKAKRATILDTAFIGARSGQRAKMEAIDEYIYPTEMDPPELPNQLTISADSKVRYITPQTPTAFETRNLGTTLEIDAVLGKDNVTVDVNLAPEIVKLGGFSRWPSEEMEAFFQSAMPTFHTMKATTQCTLTDGEYGLLGSSRPLKAAVEEREDPYVLIFVRADVASSLNWRILGDK